MNKSLKAVLLSALVYPGAGHFFLKKYTACFALAAVFSASLYFVITDIVDKANKIVEQMMGGEIPLDALAITESMSKLTTGYEDQPLNIQTYVLLIVWVIAIVDAYRIGSAKN